jgi:hypothetical protein
MKDDQIINSLVNFLIPIIFLYGLYFLSDLFIESGFFALVYSVVLIILGLMMYGINHNPNYTKSASQLEIISFSCSFISLIYLLVILMLITSLLSI